MTVLMREIEVKRLIEGEQYPRLAGSAGLNGQESACRDVPKLPTAPCVKPFDNAMTSWSQYLVDTLQRGVLYFDLLRRRDDDEIRNHLAPDDHRVALRPGGAVGFIIERTFP